MIRRAALALLTAAVLTGGLSACGFRPLYGDLGDGTMAADQLRRIQLDTRNDRIDYLVRTNLIKGLQIQYADAPPAYTLRVRMRDRREGVAVERDTSITRFNYELRAQFALSDLDTGTVLFEGRTRSVAAYNVVDNQFATLSAQRDAEERAAQAISDDIKLQVAIYFDRHASGSAGETVPPTP